MSVAIQEQFLPSLFYVLRVEGTEQFGVAVTQQACVQEATVSNIHQVTVYPSSSVSCSFLFPREKFRCSVSVWSFTLFPNGFLLIISQPFYNRL